MVIGVTKMIKPTRSPFSQGQMQGPRRNLKCYDSLLVCKLGKTKFEFGGQTRLVNFKI